jgi:hypothetical protein
VWQWRGGGVVLGGVVRRAAHDESDRPRDQLDWAEQIAEEIALRI